MHWILSAITALPAKMSFMFYSVNIYIAAESAVEKGAGNSLTSLTLDIIFLLVTLEINPHLYRIVRY